MHPFLVFLWIRMLNALGMCIYQDITCGLYTLCFAEQHSFDGEKWP